MATILERNKNIKNQKKTMSEHAEDALYREVWEDVNNQKTMEFVKKYYRHLVAGTVIILLLASGIQWWRHYNSSTKQATAYSYEIAIEETDARALAAMANNTSGATSDLALFQSYMLDKDVTKLEQLAAVGATRDFRDLAKIHLAGINGDSMSAKDFEKFLSDLNTKKSPFYYNSMLLIAQKYLADDDRKTANIWLDKIISDKDAPSVVSGSAQSLK